MSLKRVIASTFVGNGLEWYDYALYGNCAAIIAQHFFPSENPILSLIATFGVFAVGFLMRPIGAILFGYIGDKYGRKQALYISILMMAIPTACIGLLPTYESIGIAAPILLTIIRLLQGIAIGGEFGGSIVYVVEHAPEGYRNRVGAVPIVSMILGILSGSLVAAIFAKVMGQEAFNEWGWRIPFILGLFIGLVGLYIRSRLSESPEFEEARAEKTLAKSPLRETFHSNGKDLLLAIGLYFGCTIPFYIQCVFINSLLIKFLHVEVGDAFLINVASLTSMTVFTLVGAVLCDRWDRNKTLMLANIGVVLMAIPSILMLETKDLGWMLLSQIIFSGIFGFNAATISTLLVDSFPTRTRYTGMSLAVNISAAAFGGTAPAILTWLISTTDMNAIVGVYMIVAALVSLGCVWVFSRKVTIYK